MVNAREALCIVEPYFIEVRERFVDGGFASVRTTGLEVDGRVRDSRRHYAACRDDGRLVIVAPALVELWDGPVVAILAHELGHAADALYPGRFQLSEGELIDWGEGERDQRDGYRKTRQWLERTDDDAERLADALAEKVFGSPIAYEDACKPAGCLIQTFTPGPEAIRPRPLGLR